MITLSHNILLSNEKSSPPAPPAYNRKSQTHKQNASEQKPYFFRPEPFAHPEKPKHAELLFQTKTGKIVNKNRHISGNRIPADAGDHKTDASHEKRRINAAI